MRHETLELALHFCKLDLSPSWVVSAGLWFLHLLWFIISQCESVLYFTVSNTPASTKKCKVGTKRDKGQSVQCLGTYTGPTAWYNNCYAGTRSEHTANVLTRTSRGHASPSNEFQLDNAQRIHTCTHTHRHFTYSLTQLKLSHSLYTGGNHVMFYSEQNGCPKENLHE